jgi:hypothetical protein
LHIANFYIPYSRLRGNDKGESGNDKKGAEVTKGRVEMTKNQNKPEGFVIPAKAGIGLLMVVTELCSNTKLLQLQLQIALCTLQI